LNAQRVKNPNVLICSYRKRNFTINSSHQFNYQILPELNVPPAGTNSERLAYRSIFCIFISMLSRNLKLIIALLVVGTLATYVVLVVIPSQMAERGYKAAKTLSEDFKKAFQFTPEITVNSTVVLNQQTPVLELAVLTQNFEHRYAWTNTWLNSTKQINIAGTFEAKAGFDLNQKFSITLQDDQAIVILPEPVILSVESKGDITYRDENGVWNWINTDDRTKATNDFIQDARAYSTQAPFVQDAKVKMEERLKVLLQPYAKTVTIRYSTTLPEKR
jgi:hypothetical protein